MDRASIEIFLNEGEKAIFISTLLDPENIGFVFESIGGNANINILEMYAMNTAWK